MRKIYRMSEDQLKKVIDKTKKEKALIIGENEQDDNVYRNDITDGELWFQTSTLFKNNIDTKRRGGVIIDGKQYDVTFDLVNAVLSYNINLEYAHSVSKYGGQKYISGIKSISLNPIGISLTGIMIFGGDDGDFDKEFEIECDVNGIKKNTLSGTHEILGLGSVNISDLPTNIQFDIENSQISGNGQDRYIVDYFVFDISDYGN